MFRNGQPGWFQWNQFQNTFYCHGFARVLFWGVMRMVNSHTWNVNLCWIIAVYNFKLRQISRQITPGDFLLGMLTKLSIQPAESFVQGLDFDESLIIGIIWHKSNKLSTYVPNKVGGREEYVNIDFSFYK